MFAQEHLTKAWDVIERPLPESNQGHYVNCGESHYCRLQVVYNKVFRKVKHQNLLQNNNYKVHPDPQGLVLQSTPSFRASVAPSRQTCTPPSCLMLLLIQCKC